MEVRYVDADHGFAAFAPAKPPPHNEQGTTARSSASLAFRAGDTVAVEAPVVVWQQMLSRAACKAGVPNDDAPPGGAGIFRSCALCLNSLLSVEEEAARLAALHSSEVVARARGGIDAAHRFSSQSADIRRLLIGGLLERAKLVIDDSSTNDQMRKEADDAELDWSDLFMTAVPQKQQQSTKNDSDADGEMREWVVVLRSISATQRSLVLCPPNSLSSSTEDCSEEEATSTTGGWALHFCDDECLAKHEEQFNMSRWALGRRSGASSHNHHHHHHAADHSGVLHCDAGSDVNGGRDREFSTLNRYTQTGNGGAASSYSSSEEGGEVNPMVRQLLMRYLLFDDALNATLRGDHNHNNGVGVSGASDDALHSSAMHSTLAASPLVATARDQLWSMIVDGYIRSDGNLVEGRTDNTDGASGASSVAITAPPPPQTTPLQRGFDVIHTLSSTFNERYKLMVMLICRQLTKLSSLPFTSTSMPKFSPPSSSPPTSANISGDGPSDATCTTAIASRPILAVFEALDAALLDDLCASYEEGPFRAYTWRQRESLRAFCTLVNEWLWSSLLSMSSGSCSALPSSSSGTVMVGEQQNRNYPHRRTRFVSLQTLQSMAMVLDANSHSCVVLSPLYALGTSSVVGKVKEGGGQQNEEEGTTSINSILSLVLGGSDSAQCTVGHSGAHPADVSVSGLPSSRYPSPPSLLPISPSLLNNTGVALYDRCTKINHSCRPNVRFIPTFAPVRAHVVVRKGRRDTNHKKKKSANEQEKDAERDVAIDGGGGVRAGEEGEGNNSPSLSGSIIQFDGRSDESFSTGAAVHVGDGVDGIPFGAEIRTSYLDVDEEFAEEEEGVPANYGGAQWKNSRDLRRRKLKNDYGFDCDCIRCAEEKSA